MTYRTESRKSWGSVAQGWEQHAPSQRDAWMPVTARMLDAAHLQPGARVLELATGTGEVGLMAHELIQPGGELLLSDFAPEMLAVAQRNAEGLEGVRFKQIDIESIDVDAGSQDAVLCRWGLMFLLDPETGVREIRRVLRPGGRAVLAAWTAAEDNPWATILPTVMVERGLMERPDPEVPGQFALGAEGRLQELLENVGFVDDIEVVAVDVTRVEPFDAWWENLAGMSRAGRDLAAAEHDAVREACRARTEPYADADGVLHLPGRTWVASATA